MAVFLHLQDRARLFAGEPLPKTVEQVYRRYCIAVKGYSAVNFARNRRRPNELVGRPGGHRTLEGQAKVSTAFWRRYCGGERDTLRLNDVLRVLQDKAGDVAVKVRDDPVPRGRLEDVITKAGSAKSSRTVQLSVKKNDMSFEDVFFGFLSVFQTEAVEFAFDYLRFHGNCTKMLQAVKGAVSHHMDEVAGSLEIARLKSARQQEIALQLLVDHIVACIESDRRRAETTRRGGQGADLKSNARSRRPEHAHVHECYKHASNAPGVRADSHGGRRKQYHSGLHCGYQFGGWDG